MGDLLSISFKSDKPSLPLYKSPCPRSHDLNSGICWGRTRHCLCGVSVFAISCWWNMPLLDAPPSSGWPCWVDGTSLLVDVSTCRRRGCVIGCGKPCSYWRTITCLYFPIKRDCSIFIANTRSSYRLSSKAHSGKGWLPSKGHCRVSLVFECVLWDKRKRTSSSSSISFELISPRLPMSSSLCSILLTDAEEDTSEVVAVLDAASANENLATGLSITKILIFVFIRIFITQLSGSLLISSSYLESDRSYTWLPRDVNQSLNIALISSKCLVSGKERRKMSGTLMLIFERRVFVHEVAWEFGTNAPFLMIGAEFKYLFLVDGRLLVTSLFWCLFLDRK